MKRIIVAPDSFKESLNAFEVAEAIAGGFKKVFPDLETIGVPMSDGGEGFAETLVLAKGGRLVPCTVTGPLGEPVEAFVGLLGDGSTGVVEMAAASGLPLVPAAKRNPFLTTTYGTGELIKNALSMGCRQIIIGAGGSATNDGGAGMVQALGARLLTDRGDDLKPGADGLRELADIDITGLDRRLQDVEIVLAADVHNPLCGERGAAYTYGLQKGAAVEELPALDAALRHFAEVVREKMHVDMMDLPGAGAAGGLGGGLVAFLGAKIRAGIEVVLETVDFAGLLQGEVDLVVTGEGELNGQTAFGKVPAGVARLAKQFQVPVLALVGSIGPDARSVLCCGVDAYFSIVPRPLTMESSIARASEFLTDLAEQCARMIQALGKNKGGGGIWKGGI